MLAAARAEFSERGFRKATVDDIAIRSDLTRGAGYSNFPGKRALYLAVLAEEAENAGEVLNTYADDPEGALAVFASTTGWINCPGPTTTSIRDQLTHLSDARR